MRADSVARVTCGRPSGRRDGCNPIRPWADRASRPTADGVPTGEGPPCRGSPRASTGDRVARRRRASEVLGRSILAALRASVTPAFAARWSGCRPTMQSFSTRAEPPVGRADRQAAKRPKGCQVGLPMTASRPVGCLGYRARHRGVRMRATAGRRWRVGYVTRQKSDDGRGWTP